MKFHKAVSLYFEGALNSYAQIFFSNDRWFGILLIIASFIDPYVGISGFIAVLVSQFFALWLGFSQENVRNGVYGFNSVMVGLVMGALFKQSPQFFVLLVFISLFTLMMSIAFSSSLGKNRLPFLSFPFIIGVWVVILTGRSYLALSMSERGIYTINELWSYGGPTLVNLYETLNNLPIPEAVDVYLKSLGAIFFQYNIISGIIICIGLLIYSRIAFSLSIIGFVTGYFFYYYFQGDFTQLYYSYIGFNFILTAIALGGFFLIPSIKSYLIVVLVTPMIALLISACSIIMGVFQLPIYSLPFNIIVLMVIYVLQLRLFPKKLDLVVYQQFSPEKNLYKHINRLERFKNDTYIHIHLPFFGEWRVSQGHEGNITHKGDWKEAWDFDIINDSGNTYKMPGTAVEDFYCFNLPVLAPQAGYVVTIEEEIEDNPIGGVNLENNWGNTVILKHGDYLYSKLSHLKKDSIKVKEGDSVKKGDKIGTCGNSGRSPEPHIHFQLQSTPYIGSKTLKYPICYYISKDGDKQEFHSFSYPQEKQIISRVSTTKLVKDAFYFIPGNTFRFRVNGQIVEWEVFTDALNQTYIYCHTTKSYAYFVNNETLHYFTDFVGSRKSLLYHFYVAAHKILLGYYQDMGIKDQLPISTFYSGISRFVQDFVAPFYIYLKANYNATFAEQDNDMEPTEILIKTSASVKGILSKKETEFELHLKKHKLQKFVIKENGKETIAECIEE